MLTEGEADPLKADDVSTAPKGVIPDVQYEDVSAEVEARLKAKEEKKKAKKSEKKRRRESGDSSMIHAEGLPNGNSERPKKKKARANKRAEAHELEDGVSTTAAQDSKRDSVEAAVEWLRVCIRLISLMALIETRVDLDRSGNQRLEME